MSKIEKLKIALSRVFDDNLRTSQWYNFIDYIIISLILISTIEVFLSTYPGIVERYGTLLHIIDYTTIGLFTVEIALRIWSADAIDKRYRGFWGRVRYCFSFYGFIDLLSIAPFYMSHFVQFPYSMLKVLRIARLLRIFRYMKAFGILKRAISSKRNEMVVSIQFIIIITLILSFILFFVEHEAQPDVYDNCWKAILWAFAQYIGDPGTFAENNPPITSTGYFIGCIIGVLGIAIFAVPAGLIGSGFTDVMEEDKKQKRQEENIKNIIHTFRFEKDHQHTRLYTVPRYKSISSIITQKFISENNIIDAVKHSHCMHLYNLANAINAVDRPHDRIVIINYKKNTAYGCFINRGSKITIVSTSGQREPINGWLAYHIAKIGGFNYVSKEVEPIADSHISYYNINSGEQHPALKRFLDDINSLARPGSWVIPIMGAKNPRSCPTQIHFSYNDADSNKAPGTIIDQPLLDKIYSEISQKMSDEYGYHCDKNRYYTMSEKNIAHHLKADNIFVMSIENFVWMFDSRYLAVIKTIADTLNSNIEPEKAKELPPEMLTRQSGKDYGMNNYTD